MTPRFHISLPQIDPAWERPTPSARELRTDVLIWVLVLAISLLLTAAYHSTGLFGGEPDSVTGAYLASAGMTLPLILRRRYPLTMLLTGTVLFFMLSLLNSIVAATMSFQFIYLAVIYSAIAWAKNRAMLWVLFTLICLSVLVWLASLWAINGASFSLFGIEDYSGGLFSVPTASYIATFLANLIYFSCGMLVGRVSWRAAYQQALLQEQQVQLEEQAQQLADSAVTRDRLRIARELHDSVGHHVSAMGIQAAAARRALNKKPELASAPLEKVEDLARSSVTEMKSIIRVLRSDQDAQGASAEPGIADLTSLIESLGDAGIKGQLQFTGQSYAHLNQLTQGTQLSIYRVVQEALTNVRKHSSARHVLVVLRTGTDSTGAGWAEVEITDDGRNSSTPQPVSSKVPKGYGLAGIRERAQALGGGAEFGQRQGSEGWRVRLRFPANFEKGK